MSYSRLLNFTVCEITSEFIKTGLQYSRSESCKGHLSASFLELFAFHFLLEMTHTQPSAGPQWNRGVFIRQREREWRWRGTADDSRRPAETEWRAGGEKEGREDLFKVELVLPSLVTVVNMVTLSDVCLFCCIKSELHQLRNNNNNSLWVLRKKKKRAGL